MKQQCRAAEADTAAYPLQPYSLYSQLRTSQPKPNAAAKHVTFASTIAVVVTSAPPPFPIPTRARPRAAPAVAPPSQAQQQRAGTLRVGLVNINGLRSAQHADSKR